MRKPFRKVSECCCGLSYHEWRFLDDSVALWKTLREETVFEAHDVQCIV